MSHRFFFACFEKVNQKCPPRDHVPSPLVPWLWSRLLLFCLKFDNQVSESDPSSTIMENDHVFAEISPLN